MTCGLTVNKETAFNKPMNTRNQQHLRRQQLFAGASCGPLKKWVDHIEQFALSYDLLPPSGRAVIALSGGADSRALTLFLLALKKRGLLNQLHAVYIDHGMRAESRDEAHELLGWCKELGIDYSSEKVNEQFQNNREARARGQRYRLLRRHLYQGDALYMGHHIDDSFEWHLLQSWRSGQLESSIGIPVSRGVIKRPLMAFTREQIERFLRILGESYFSDQSNCDESFERNWIRQQIATRIKQRHPNYLKNYVSRMSLLVAKLELKRKGKSSQRPSWDIQSDPSGGVVLNLHDSLNCREGRLLIRDELRHLIERMSTVGRGKLRAQLDKLVAMARENKWGPLTFSGGVQAFVSNHQIFLANSKVWQNWNNWDGNWVKIIQNKSYPNASQIPVGDIQSARPSDWPWPRLLLVRQLDKNNMTQMKRFYRKWHKSQSHLSRLKGLFPQLYAHLEQDAGVYWWGTREHFLRRFESMTEREKKNFDQNFSTFYLAYPWHRDYVYLGRNNPTQTVS